MSKQTPYIASRQGGIAKELFDSVDGMIDSMANTAEILVGACYRGGEILSQTSYNDESSTDLQIGGAEGPNC